MINLFKSLFKTEDNNTLSEKEGDIYEENISNDNQIIEITYNELLELKLNNSFDSSKRYRLIDYLTTTVQKNTSSARHQFDLLLTPISENKLDVNAVAIQHDGDEYFKNCELSEWVVKYDIDNNPMKYEWADVENGKGVIFYLKDEYDNEAPYDFKNIMFKRWGVKGKPDAEVLYGNVDRETEMSYAEQIDYERSDFYYTFSTLRYGNQVLEPKDNKSDTYTHLWILDMTVEPFVYPYGEAMRDRCMNNVIQLSRSRNGRLTLNDTVLIGFPSYWHRKESGGKALVKYSNISNNRFSYDCIGNTLCGEKCVGNEFETNCEYNTLYNDCSFNAFGSYSKANFFEESSINISGISFCDNVLKKSSHNWFGENCKGNIFEDSKLNKLYNICIENVLTNSNANIFDSACRVNNLNHSDGNRFGYCCCFNKMDNNCKSNVLGNECIYNTFSENCNNNTFSSNVSYIELMQDNSYNEFRGNNYYIKLHGGVQNVIVDEHICGIENEPLERELEPAVPYKQHMIVNKENTIEVI